MFGVDNTIDLRLRNEKVLKFRLIRNAIAKGAKNVLEIGCGGGTVIRTLAESFPNTSFIGYDTDTVAIEYANKCKLPNLQFVSTLDGLIDNNFDHIILVDCLEHVDKPLALMERIHGLLRDGGTTIIHIPLEKQGIYANKYCRDIKSIYSQHVNFYDLASLVNVLTRAGFIIQNKSFHYHLISGARDFMKYYLLYRSRIHANKVSNFYSKDWCAILESTSLKRLMSIWDWLAYYESLVLENVNLFSSGVTVVGLKK